MSVSISSEGDNPREPAEDWLMHYTSWYIAP